MDSSVTADDQPHPGCDEATLRGELASLLGSATFLCVDVSPIDAEAGGRDERHCHAA